MILKCKNCLTEEAIYGSKIFCSKSCQISFANKNRTEEQKKNAKIATLKSLEKRFKKIYDESSCKKCGKKIAILFNLELKTGIKRRKGSEFCCRKCACSYSISSLSEEKKEAHKRKISMALSKEIPDIKRICIGCGIEFLQTKNKNRIQKFHSIECSRVNNFDVRSRACSEAMKKSIHEGKHKGWMTRNLTSYAERFFIKVLNSNGLSNYKFNHPISKKDLGEKEATNYFLDFFFENKKIDLEIDGKQHEYPDRKISDEKRDRLLKNSGIIVYRIKWKSINNVKGREYIRNEIKKFIDFYNSVRC